MACGALAHEIVHLIRLNAWTHVDVQCLPAEYHNTPQRIPDAVRRKIEEGRARYRRIFVAYADCGTGGELDRALRGLDVERIPGAHCYEFFAGASRFAELHEAEPGTFYLTDFLARHFDRLIWRGLGIERFPELRDEYFRNYRRVVYLAQTRDEHLLSLARAAARRLGLDFEHRVTGYGDLDGAMQRAVRRRAVRGASAPGVDAVVDGAALERSD